MSLNAPTKSFKGAYTARLDDKRRLTIPADWRFEGEGASAYLAVYHPAHGAIMVLPPDMKDRIEAASRRPDALLLVFGVLTLVAAVATFVGVTLDLSTVDPRWVIAGGAAAVGTWLLVSGLRGRRRAT